MKWNARRVWIMAGAAASLAAVPSVAEACSCLPQSLSASWHESTDTMRGRVVDHKITGDVHRYQVEVLRPFSGCTDPRDVVVVETSRSEAACGTTLDVGEIYLLTANQDPGRDGVYGIGLCGYNRLWSTVSASDREFLASRPVACASEPAVVTCGDGSAPVQCLVNSCEVEPACGQAVTCEFNTCGGCDAEFYDASWTPVCSP